MWRISNLCLRLESHLPILGNILVSVATMTNALVQHLTLVHGSISHHLILQAWFFYFCHPLAEVILTGLKPVDVLLSSRSYM